VGLRINSSCLRQRPEVLHCHQEWPGEDDWSGIDIFRFDENEKIVEHWNVLQVVPEASANDNTMF
jgi:predicted SnoaL-like aldol condensation-catalyzing enzyme